ncbi:chemotaxis protein CheW [Paucibacter sp. PLA-PC-4]|uniref:chemotaxis protein CheW n=1 Tax=Paucibacter sp. PLA-PC-4 TaxID=2993655 RepID=UPI0022497DFD|nr:chemotaxis protein CheW [Paucibacter sp. PLA-PC-4]MCX2861256.1 chemotaxis protein CheW [Paucibacter sp. PLA-PC-4]
MSNKQALRELQQRLAQRMQAAREQPQQASWLAVECAGMPLLFSLLQASEIFTPVPLQTVPYAQPWLLGVANLRGGLHTVVDLAAFLGLREAAAVTRSEGARLIAINPDLGINCALMVDRLLGLRGAMQAETPDEATPRPRFAGGLMRDQEGRRWQVIDLEALARHEQFLRIVA